jgi:phosphate transport system protein
MDNTPIKKLQFELLNKDFEWMATTVLHQFTLVENFVANGGQKETYEQLIENESIIDSLETAIMEKLSRLVILFSPRAAELRKIISCHEVILSLEQIGDSLMNLMEYMQKVKLIFPDYDDLAGILKKMYDILKLTGINNLGTRSCEEGKR